MSKPRESRNLSVSIDCSYVDAYRFLSVPENFSKWASGLAASLRQVAGQWLADSPEGQVIIRFSETNDFGVLDHWVGFESGVQIYIPLRVIANGSGCELTLTLFRLSGMSDEKFAADAEWVMRDLVTVKQLLECKG
jgi:hypothetical protein